MIKCISVSRMITTVTEKGDQLITGWQHYTIPNFKEDDPLHEAFEKGGVADPDDIEVDSIDYNSTTKEYECIKGNLRYRFPYTAVLRIIEDAT